MSTEAYNADESPSARIFVFRDDMTENINVVYKRKDGDYGLIVPEED